MSLLTSCAFSFVVAWLFWRIFRAYVVRSPLDNLPGPTRSSFLLGEHFFNITPRLYLTPPRLVAAGNLTEFFSRDGWDFQDAIGEAHGAVVKFNGMLGVSVSCRRQDLLTY